MFVCLKSLQIYSCWKWDISIDMILSMGLRLLPSLWSNIMQHDSTNLDITSINLILSAEERNCLLKQIPDLPSTLVAKLSQPYIRLDRVSVSVSDLEVLEESLNAPFGRSISRESRVALRQIHEQVVEELILLNAKTSSVAVDNGAHALFKSRSRGSSEISYQEALHQLAKLRALPLRLREFKLSAKERRLLQSCPLAHETLQRIHDSSSGINLADVLLIFAARYSFDRGTAEELVHDLLELRKRILDYLDQLSRRTVEINRERTLRSPRQRRLRASES